MGPSWLPAPAPQLAGNANQMLGLWPGGWAGGGERKWLGAVGLECKQGLAGLKPVLGLGDTRRRCQRDRARAPTAPINQMAALRTQKAQG